LALTHPALAESGYSESRAVKYAKLAGAAYCNTSLLETWTCEPPFCSESVTDVKVCQGATTKAFVGLWEGKGLVSFEGTHGTDAMMQDLKIEKALSSFPGCDGCELHSGFLDEWNSLRSCVTDHLSVLGSSTIRTTGHSLGASLSIIGAFDLTQAGYTIEESYDFGRPRTGSVEFARACEALFGDKVYRITHSRDPVVQLPPDHWGSVDWHYEHSGPEVFYDKSDDQGYVICSDVHDQDCSAKYWAITNSIPDHLRYMDLPISSCSSGAIAMVV